MTGHQLKSARFEDVRGSSVAGSGNGSFAFFRSWRQLRLDQQFAVTAAVVIFIGMAILAAWVSDRITRGVVQNMAGNTALYLVGFVEPHVQELADNDRLSEASMRQLDNMVQTSLMGGRVVAIKVWTHDGTIAYSSDHKRIGQKFPVTDDLEQAFQGRVSPEYNELDHAESEIERQLNLPMLEIYTPIRDVRTNKIIAVAEIYETAEELARDLRLAYMQTNLVVASISLALLASLFHIVRSGSRTIETQRVALSERVDELTHLLAENRKLQANVASANRRAAQANEQFLRRVGAELHDGPAQLLALGLLRLDALKKRLKPLEQGHERDDLAIIRDALDDALKEVRGICAGIAIPELQNASLEQAIRIAVGNHENRTGSKVELELPQKLPDTLSLPLNICAFRFVQEGLNNAFRHADAIGQKVALKIVDDRLLIEVSDQGPGFGYDGEADPNAASGLGLLGLKHRIEAVGGSFDIRSQPGEGTSITAYFNLEELGLHNG